MPVTLRDSPVSLSEVELDGDRFDDLCRAHDAETETARAALVGIERRTLYRWREGLVTPGLDAALRTAQRLDTTVEDLWRQRGTKPLHRSNVRAVGAFA